MKQWLVGGLWLMGAVSAQTLQQATGQVEQYRETWLKAKVGDTITTPLRTTQGRATIQVSDGSMMLADYSQVKMYNSELQVLQGQAYAKGGFAFHAGPAHVRFAGTIRIDFINQHQVISVLSGSANVSLRGKPVVGLQTGERFDLTSETISVFKELEAWYLNQIQGYGVVTLAAKQGVVQLVLPESSSDLKIKQSVKAGQTIQTAKNSWAEFNFADGSYFRLNPESTIKLLNYETTTDDKKYAVLQLEKGTAWNVVTKDKGNYIIRTTTLVAGVRGTSFRLDDNNTVKVFEGTVGVENSKGSQDVHQSQQYNPDGTITALTVDTTDRLNIQLDEARRSPLTLSLNAPDNTRVVSGKTHAGTEINYQINQEPVQNNITVDNQGFFFIPLDVPDGKYRIQVKAAYQDKLMQDTVSVVIDRTAPQLENITASISGSTLTITGDVADSNRVSVEVLGYKLLWNNGKVIVPRVESASAVEIVFIDALGNNTKTVVPLQQR